MGARRSNHHIARGRVIAVAASAFFVTGMLVVGAGPAHATSTTCSYNGTTDTMTVGMAANGLTATISRSGTNLAVGGVTCGSATSTNTETIVVNGSDGRQDVTIDLSNGPIGPGTSPEGDDDEIEIQLHLGAGTDLLTVTGSAITDDIRLGAGGINLNGDTDADITLPGVDRITINGNSGPDTLSAAGGLGTGGPTAMPVFIHGGDSADAVTGGNGRDSVFGDTGNDDVNGGAGQDYVYGGDNVDTVHGGSGDDYVYGDLGNDVLNGDGGDDTFGSSVADGSDTIAGGSGYDYISYYSRTNAITATINNVANDGEAGENDNLKTDVEGITGAWTASNNLTGSAGPNSLSGGNVTDTLSGGDGKDNLYGNAGIDHEDGGDDDDYVYGYEGADILNAGGGDDTVYGGLDNDTIDAGDGDDYVYEESAPNGADDISGGRGEDVISYSNRTADITVTLDSNADDGQAAEGDRIRNDVENITGGQAKNHLVGSAADNDIYSPYGSTGADFMNGGGGADYLVSYGGADTLIGGDGEDSMYGGDGADTFKAADGGYDYVNGGDGTDVLVNSDPGIDNVVEVP